MTQIRRLRVTALAIVAALALAPAAGGPVERFHRLEAVATLEFSCAAPPAAPSASASTWSRWSAMSGETTTVAPGASSPAIW